MNYTVKILKPKDYSEFLICEITEMDHFPFIVEIGDIKYLRTDYFESEVIYSPLLKYVDILTMQGKEHHYEIKVTGGSKIYHNKYLNELNSGYFRGIEKGMTSDIMYVSYDIESINHINGKTVYNVTDALTGYKEPTKIFQEKIDQYGQMRLF